MSSRLPPLALLRTFDVAARHLSFKRAAAELHVTPAAVSQQIKALEAHLGVRLFDRLTRALRLSPSGAALWPGVQEGVAQLQRAVEGVQAGEGDAARVVVTAPPSFASYWLVPRLAGFYAAHPGVEVRLSSSSAVVERGADARLIQALSDPADGGFGSLTVIYGAGGYLGTGVSVDRLFTPNYTPVCTPALWRSAADVTTDPRPADLLAGQVLIHDDTLGAPGHKTGAAWGWPQWLAAEGQADRRAGAGDRHFSNAVLALEATLAGQGVGLAAQELVVAHLMSGQLVRPFERAMSSPFSYFLVARTEELVRPAAAAFRQWLLAQTAPA